MANQRKKGIERITLTIPDEMLARLEEHAEERGMDRLALMREALRSYLATPRPTSSTRGAKTRASAK